MAKNPRKPQHNTESLPILGRKRRRRFARARKKNQPQCNAARITRRHRTQMVCGLPPFRDVFPQICHNRRYFDQNEQSARGLTPFCHPILCFASFAFFAAKMSPSICAGSESLRLCRSPPFVVQLGCQRSKPEGLGCFHTPPHVL